MKLLKKFWPLGAIALIWFILFLPFFTKGLLPIPADIITGVYYPWLDYKWGYAVGVPVKNPLLSDVPSLLYPWRSLVIDELKAFRWPLWNPYYFTGMPLLANFQSAAFSYVNLFFLFLPKAYGWSLGVMSSPLLTMLAVYFFLRNKKLCEISALLGAVVFSLSGFEIAWLEYNVLGHTALFLPLFLLAIDKIFAGGKRWLGILSFLIALQIFTGYIPIVIYSYLLCLFYILYLYFLSEKGKKKIFWRRYFLLASFWVVGILLASVQLFPGIELMQNSIRKIDPLVGSSGASYLPFKHLATLLAPDYFGSPATHNYFGKGFYDNFYFFAGTPVVILLMYSLFLLKRNKEMKFWWFCVLFSLLLVFDNPLGRVLMAMFQLSGGVAARALFITGFSFAVISALSLEKLLRKGDSERKISFCITQIFLLFLSLFFFSLALPWLRQRNIAQRNLILPFLLYISSSLLLAVANYKTPFFLWVRTRFPKRWYGKIFLGCYLAFVFLVALQLLYSARKYLPFTKKELVFPHTPVIDFLRERSKETTEPFRVELGDVVPQNFLMAYGIETTSGYDALLPKRIGEFIVGLNLQKSSSGISRVQLVTNYNSPLFLLTNTKYIFIKKSIRDGVYGSEGTPPEEFKNIKRFKLAFEDGTVQVYENHLYLPRAFLVYEYVVLGENSSLDEISREKIDFGKTVVLEKIGPGYPVTEVLEKIETKVRWLDNQPGKYSMTVESSSPGFLVVLNNYYPGWKAFVDGRQTEIFRANFAFRAVFVPKGQHRVSFVYDPVSFKAGLVVSLISLISLTILVFGLFLRENGVFKVKLPLLKK